MSNDNSSLTRVQRPLYNLHVALILLYLLLNFLGLPELKYLFILTACTAMLSAISLPWEKSIKFIILFLFIEGQGRILWNYHPIARTIFDLILLIAIFKNIISNRKIVSIKQLPIFLSLAFTFHFLWFLVELFNPTGAGVLASLATSKYYIFPFLVFFTCLRNPLPLESQEMRNFITLISVIVVLECILCIYQLYMGREFLYQIAPFYRNIDAKFATSFRPYGTSFTGGSMSTFLYLTIGLQFLYPKRTKLQKLSLILFVILSWITLLICQIRAAWIIHMAITFGCLFFAFFSSKLKFKSLVAYMMGLAILLGTSSLFIQNSKQINDVINIKFSLTRIESLFTGEKGFWGQRSSLNNALETAGERLSDNPFGYGPGMTTAFLEKFRARQRQLVDIPSHQFWNLDNLFIFLVSELGIGSIFYLFIVLSFPVILFARAKLARKNSNHQSFMVISCAFVTVLVITLANWGAASIPFNPVSFYYWLWISIGLTAICYKKDNKEPTYEYC